jgi:hypothetical protein
VVWRERREGVDGRLIVIDWMVTKAEAKLIGAIVKRAVELASRNGVPVDAMQLSMDLTACHANGCPLRLEDLLAADDGNFGHDVFGIRRYIDRKTGKLTDCFVPRFASREAAKASGK